MDTKEPIYLIQLFDQKNTLINKYKLTGPGRWVSDLKQKVRDVLLKKKHISYGDHLAIKDSEGWELCSDDEIEDVLIGDLVCVYVNCTDTVKKDNVSKNVSIPPFIQIDNKVKTEFKIHSQLETQILPSDTQKENETCVEPQISENSEEKQYLPQTKIKKENEFHPKIPAINLPIIDISQFQFPNFGSEKSESEKWKFILPQMNSTRIEIEPCDDLNFLELSKYIIKTLNLEEKYKALIYTSEGVPLLFNLDMIYLKAPRLILENTYYIIFSVTISPSAEIQIDSPKEITETMIALKVNFNKDFFIVNIDFENTVSLLKYKIFLKLGIPPQNQILATSKDLYRIDGVPSENEKLSECKSFKTQEINLYLKEISNVYPFGYSGMFFYKDVQLIHPQSEQSYRAFKSNILALGHHLDEVQKREFLAFIRYDTRNEPLVCALRAIFFHGFLSQTLRIALEEGFYCAIWNYLKKSISKPQTESKYVLNHIRHYLGYVFKSMEVTEEEEIQLWNIEYGVMLSKNCYYSGKEINIPAIIFLDNGDTVIVDKDEVLAKIKNKEKFRDWEIASEKDIEENEILTEHWAIYKLNNEYSKYECKVNVWLGRDCEEIPFEPQPIEEVEKYENCISLISPDLQILKPLEVKNNRKSYLMFLNKQYEYRIFLGTAKDIKFPHRIFDVLTGEEELVNLDLMNSFGKTENLNEVLDLKNLKPVITREPKEAIVVLFDTSLSMNERFFYENDLKRLGACKSFFEAFSYRTLAYNFEHAVSLIFFSDKINVVSDFTESIYDFNRLVSFANPEGSTKLFDAIDVAVDNLLKFKKKFPNCILRIIALTDGEDNQSKNECFEVTRKVLGNNIIIDSFAVGSECEGLKAVTLATGGRCYLTRSLDASLKLFEQETILSVRARKFTPPLRETSDRDILNYIQRAKTRGFDLVTNIYEFKVPEAEGSFLSAPETLEKYSTQQGKIRISSNKLLMRVAKEIREFIENPHPHFIIFPCEDITFWKILLLGPKSTPYEGGLFLLYAYFSEEYPLKPPEVRFITKIYHCNVNQQGRICHSIFDRNYSPQLTFKQIIDCVFGLILTPEPEDPLDSVIASEYISSYPEYYSKATHFTLTKAVRNIEQVGEEIFEWEKNGNGWEKNEKIMEINEWLENARKLD